MSAWKPAGNRDYFGRGRYDGRAQAALRPRCSFDHCLIFRPDLAHKRERCVCAGGNPQGQKHEILLCAKGRGERGGYDLLKGRLISWLNARFFCAGLL